MKLSKVLTVSLSVISIVGFAFLARYVNLSSNNVSVQQSYADPSKKLDPTISISKDAQSGTVSTASGKMAIQATPAPTPTGTFNIAPYANSFDCTAGGGACSGIRDGASMACNAGEWFTDATLPIYAQLNWTSPVKITGVRIYDRMCGEYSESGTIDFGDAGNTTENWNIASNDGYTDVTFASKTVTSVKVNIAVASGGTNQGLNEIQVFLDPASLPTVSINAATDIMYNSANLSAHVTTSDVAAGGYGFVYSSVNTVPTWSDSTAYTFTTTADFAATISALTPSTTYYARAFVATPYGGVLSDTVISFTTPENILASETLDTQMFVLPYSATVLGKVTGDGGNTITERGMVYSTTNATPTTADSKAVVAGAVGDLSVTLNNLTGSTHYYYRAFVTTSAGTAYGVVKELTTTAAVSPLVNGGLFAVNSNAGNEKYNYMEDLDQTTFAVTSDRALTMTGHTVNASYGLAQSPTTGEVFTITQVDASPNTKFHLAKLNLETGVLTDVGAITSAVGSKALKIANISFRSNGTLYVVTGDGDANYPETLFTVDLSTAVATQVMALGNGDDGEAIGFGADGLLYHFSGWGSPIFEKIDVDTQEVTNIVLSGFSTDIKNIFTLVYTGDNTFLASGYSNNRYIAEATFWKITTSGEVGSSFTDNPTTYKGLMYYTMPKSASVLSTTADVTATVANDGGAAVSERGVVYSTTNSTPTLSDSKKTAAGTTGVFTTAMTDLTPETRYYVRSYATNSVGTSYSGVIEFTTAAAGNPPTVTTTAQIPAYGATTAQVLGNVTADGGLTVTERGVVYSSTNNTPTTSDSKQTGTGTTGTMTVQLSGLTPYTTYYVRAYATNSAGTGYGAVVTFRTIPMTLQNVYFTFGKLQYGKYAAPSTVKTGDTIYLKNYDPKKIQLLAISLYDYATKGNQCYTRSWKSTTSMYMKTCGLLPTKRKYAFIFTFKDVATGVVVKKYFVINTISAGTITL